MANRKRQPSFDTEPTTRDDASFAEEVSDVFPRARLAARATTVHARMSSKLRRAWALVARGHTPPHLVRVLQSAALRNDEALLDAVLEQLERIR